MNCLRNNLTGVIPSNLCVTPIDEELDTGDKTAISKVGVTVNIPITLASTDRGTMMTRETRKRLQVYDR